MFYYLLFTSDHCKACPQMKKNVQALNLGHFEFNVDKKVGSKIAQEFKIMSLPTFIISGSMEPKDEIKRLPGLWATDKITESINTARKEA